MSSFGDPSRPLPKWLSVVRLFVRALRNYYLVNFVLRKKAKFGCRVNIGFGSVLQPPNYLILSDRVSVGRNLFLQSNLNVGSDTLISSNVSFVGNDHDFTDPSLSVFSGRRLPPSSVSIEGDSLIGFGVIVVGNVTIGRGVIVGAGSVVTCDLPPFTICVGVPAKPIRLRYIK